jgi:hypothetical protein
MILSVTMNVDTLLIRIVLLLMPGLAGYRTFRTIQSMGKSRKQKKDWQDFLSMIFLSVLAYGLLYAVYLLINVVGAWAAGRSPALSVTSIDALLNEKVLLNYFEIVYASLLAMLIGVLAGVVYNKKVVFRVARTLRITDHYGDDDVWSYVMNSDDVEWLFVRDHRVGLVYYGSPVVFSESDEKREILLDDVDVYSNADGKKLYHIDSLYVSRQDSELTLEIPRQRKYIGREEPEDIHVGPASKNKEHPGRKREKRGK